ncbi:sensor histidine kinase [Bacillus sp. Marseille-Q1617]|uniref:sensor histidine kinase n=1 Tax=Bacillus sp. Marseille-Q1617 TaxID=2736887 RepID=UPI00158AB9AB|nr:sensor histidine kinase [Bacillus sp. Marseille-Q1617]
MAAIIIRTIFLGLLWSAYIYDSSQDSISMIFLMLLCSLSFACFFITPVSRNRLFLYICQTLLLLISSLVSPEPLLAWGIFCYFHLEASTQLSPEKYQMFMYTAILFSGIEAFLFWDSYSPAVIPFFAMFFFMTWKLNERCHDLKEQRVLYDELIGEYRKLKRILYVTERNSKAEERTRIAREIHDSVGHNLTALLMKIQMLSIEHGHSLFKEIKNLAAESLDETREAVKALKEGEVEGIQSVIHLIRKLESESSVMVELTTQQGVLSTRLSNKQNIAVYRCIQEGITNAMKHSSVKEVKVTLGKTALGHLHFKIINQLNQLDNIRPFQMGFGLTNMKERIEELGGNLEIHQTDKEFILGGAFPVEEVAKA